jgi:hypothetical protein
MGWGWSASILRVSLSKGDFSVDEHSEKFYRIIPNAGGR